MNLKNLDDQALRSQIQLEVRKENEQTTRVLHHLREVNHRKLWAAWGFSDLKSYCIQELGYTDQAARRRIDAMFLLQAMPEYGDKVRSGDLTMSVISQAQSFFRQEEMSAAPVPVETKKEILEALQGKSTREADRLLMTYSARPAPEVKEGIKAVSQTHSEVRFVANDQLLEQLEQIRGLLSNSQGDLSLSEVIAQMAQITLAKLDPARQKSRATKSVTPPAPESSAADASVFGPETQRGASDIHMISNSRSESQRRPYLPRELVRQIYRRDQSCCAWVDPTTGRRCGSRCRLQIDHILEFAKGGLRTLNNLRLLCFHHNQFRAIESFGLRKMEIHWAGR